MQILLLSLVVIVNLFLCILVLTRARDLTPRYFALSGLFIVVWGLGALGMLYGKNHAIVTLGLATYCLAPMLTAYFMVLFSASFVNVRHRTLVATSWSMAALFIVAAGWSAAHLGKSLVSIAPNGLESNSFTFQLGWFYVYALYFLCSFSVSYLFFLFGLFKKHAKQKRAVSLVFAGIFATSILALATNVVLPLIGYNQLLWLGPVWTAFYIFTTSFAMIRHRLFDIRLAAVRTVAYILTLVTLGLLYFVLAYLVSVVFIQDQSVTIQQNPVNIALALILAFVFQPIKTFFDRVTDSIFYRNRYNPEEFIALLSNILSATTELRDLLVKASDVIGLTMKSRQVFFAVQYPGRGHVTAGTRGHQAFSMEEIHRLELRAPEYKGKIIVTDKLSARSDLYRILSRNGVALLLPLWHEGVVTGWLSLGDSLGSQYSQRDLRVLSTIADELVIAIQNALSLEQVRETNANLQARIDTATHSLRLSNDKLRRLDDTKDEFISMASHQLRTPLTSVKGYVSMILDGDAGPVNPQQRKFLTEAFDSSNRMAGIIGDFLNVSRLQTGKFSLERETVDLGEVVSSEIEHLQNTARVRGLDLHYRRPAHFPDMMLDKSKIEQVVMNLIDNAIFYAPDTGAVEIELFQRAGRAVFTVRDHGIGVPKHEQANLFTKFFRATNARQKRPDGTGVGLFLAKKVVVAHGGTIIFESSEGKGSTFGFEIPLRG